MVRAHATRPYGTLVKAIRVSTPNTSPDALCEHRMVLLELSRGALLELSRGALLELSRGALYAPFASKYNDGFKCHPTC